MSMSLRKYNQRIPRTILWYTGWNSYWPLAHHYNSFQGYDHISPLSTGAGEFFYSPAPIITLRSPWLKWVFQLSALHKPWPEAPKELWIASLKSHNASGSCLASNYSPPLTTSLIFTAALAYWLKSKHGLWSISTWRDIDMLQADPQSTMHRFY